MGLPVEISTGGTTKFNRSRLNAPKTHALDAACTRNTPESQPWRSQCLPSKQATEVRINTPIWILLNFLAAASCDRRRQKGFRSETWSVQSYPRENEWERFRQGWSAHEVHSIVQTRSGTVSDIGHKYCRMSQRADGYAYEPKQKNGNSPPSALTQEFVVLSLGEPSDEQAGEKKK